MYLIKLSMNLDAIHTPRGFLVLFHWQRGLTECVGIHYPESINDTLSYVVSTYAPGLKSCSSLINALPLYVYNSCEKGR